MFVTEIRDSNDLLAAIGDAMVYCLLCLLFVSLYAYMFMFCFTTSGVKYPFLWMIFTNEFFIIKCPVLLFSRAYSRFRWERKKRIKLKM